MIVTVNQLRLIHYFYFVMGIFGLANAIFMGFGSPFSMLFLAFYAVNSGISWYMAHVARRKMSSYVVVQSLGFFISHTILAVLTVGGTTLIWVSGIIPDIQLLSTLLTANYFAVFLAGLWYGLIRADFIRDLFTIYDSHIFKKAKAFIIRIKEAYCDFFGRQLVTVEEIRDYRYGTIGEVDENLISAWKNRKKLQYVLECLGRIELSMARHALQRLREKISFLRMTPGNENEKPIARAEGKLHDRENEILKYEKTFYRKTGESELLQACF
jgi:hypothetical protein